MIENDADDRFLTQEMFQQLEFETALNFVSSKDVAFVLDDPLAVPQLILLSQPAMDDSFTDLIKKIRSTPGYGLVPLVVLSSSVHPEDVRKSYAAGASSFIRKPADYGGTVFKITSFINYWFRSVELPVA